MKSEEIAKKMLEIDSKLYKYLTRFNKLKNQREKILAFAEKNGVDEALKQKMQESLRDFDNVLKAIQELEMQTKKLKQ